jgi:O-antigen/teichoic acid export membrane protein
MTVSSQVAVGGTSTARVVRNSTLVLLLQFVLLGCAVTNNFLVARMAGPVGKGLLYLVQLITFGIGLPFLHFSLGFSAIYFLGQDKELSRIEIASGMLLPSIVLGLLPAGLLVATWNWFGLRFMQALPPHYLWIALLALPAAVLTFNISQMSLGLHEIGNYNLLCVGTPLVFAICLGGLILNGSYSISSIAIGWGASVLIPAVFAFVLAFRIAEGHLSPTRRFLRKAYGFGWRSHLGGVTQQLQHRLPVLLVGYFLPISDLGIYSLAVSLSELLWYLPNAVSTVLMPHVASSSDEVARRSTPVFCRITVAVTATLSIGMIAFSLLVIPRFLPAFMASLKVLYILTPGVVLAAVFKVLSSDFNGRGRPLYAFYPALGALAVELILGVIFIPRYGIVAAASITTAGYTLNSLLYGFSYRRLTGTATSDLLLLTREDLFRMRAAAGKILQSLGWSSTALDRGR